MKKFEDLTLEEKKPLMGEFLQLDNSDFISFQDWYELEYLEMACLNGK